MFNCMDVMIIHEHPYPVAKTRRSVPVQTLRNEGERCEHADLETHRPEVMSDFTGEYIKDCHRAHLYASPPVS